MPYDPTWEDDMVADMVNEWLVQFEV